MAAMSSIVEKFFAHKNAPLFVSLCVALFFGFFKLGVHPLMEWDESFHGEIALQMLRNGDWFNYYFGGKPEAWFAKPPLAIWAIVLSYKVFGINAFALRFPSAIAIVVTFYFIFQITRQYKGSRFAFFTTLMLISINGLIGPHVGRSGDTDALLVCFLTGSSWFFLRYIDFKHTFSGYLIGLFLGIAFWAKGPVAFIFLPGWFLYLLHARKLKKTMLSPITWASIGIFLAFICAWVLATVAFGNEFIERPYEGKNTLETMFLYDIVRRFFENNTFSESFYFFYNMDSKFSVWNFLIYTLLILSVMQGSFKKVFEKDRDGWLHLYALFVWLPFVLFLTFSRSKNTWYMAPVLPLIGINAWGLILFYYRKYYLIKLVSIILFITTLGIKVKDVGFPKKYVPFLTRNEKNFTDATSIVATSKFPFDHILYMHFRNKNLIVEPSINKVDIKKGSLLLVDRTKYQAEKEHFKRWDRVDSNDVNFILRKP